MKPKYYITTAIAYASAIPHIGNVYEIILADAIARFKRLEGYDVYFQTGTDDHGQKIEQNAKNNDLSPKQYVDMISSEIKRIYDLVNISYDSFVRTTDEDHVKAVQDMFEKLLKKGDIYLGKYEGWYSIADESFLSENEMVKAGDLFGWWDTFLNWSTKKIVTSLKWDTEVGKILKQNYLISWNFIWLVLKIKMIQHVYNVWVMLFLIILLNRYNINNPSDLFNKLYLWLTLVGKDVMRFHTVYCDYTNGFRFNY